MSVINEKSNFTFEFQPVTKLECRLYYKWSDLPSRGMDLSGNRQY